ncbi:MAG: TonB-dependent receptor [Cyclobacteriaceae bacterium]
MIRLIIFISIVLYPLFGGAQSIVDFKLNATSDGQTLTSILTDIELAGSARCFYLPEWTDDFVLDKSCVGMTLSEALEHLFQGTELNYVSPYPNVIVLVRDPKNAIRRKEILVSAQKQGKQVSAYRLGEKRVGIANTELSVSGKIIDESTGESIPFVNIQVDDSHNTTTSDEDGHFELTVTSGSHILSFSFLDYENLLADLEVYDQGEIEVKMVKNSRELEEVVVHGTILKEVTTSRIGQTELIMKELKNAPAFLGEVDLVKHVQTLPGVTTVGEAASGFNVRGGSVDQNLILHDGVPIFNSSHVFGFLTAFNPEAVREVTFYKGGTPAEYGGRASSVLDVSSKDGDYENWNGKAGLGMITASLMVNGPIQKGKTSFSSSFRSTYSNWLIHAVETNYADLSESAVSFYDGTAKLSHLFTDKSKLSITAYASHDSFRLFGDSTYKWNNRQITAMFYHQFSSSMGAEFVLGSSGYSYSVLNRDLLTASELSYGINATTLKAGFNHEGRFGKKDFGVQILRYQFEPGQLKPRSSSSNTKSVNLTNQFAYETALYMTDFRSLNDRLYLETGLRIPLFISMGPASIYKYRSGEKEVNNISDTLTVRRGRTVKSYIGLAPRLSLRYMLDKFTSVKFGYNRMYQYLHLVTNTTAVSPLDVWSPSGYYFEPQRSDQVSMGIFGDSKSKDYSASLELFYKLIKNVPDFKDGAQLILNEHLETELLQGKGTSYGLETSFSKNKGDFTGTLNYTFSRAFRTVKGPTEAESINQGKRYRANYDQPHNINFSWKYDFSRRYALTGNFTYQTGRPVTIPLSAFRYENTTIAYYSGRNQYRIPDYHRLDLALVMEGNHKVDTRVKGRWVFSIYNVYGRKNPYSIFFQVSDASIPQPYQLSIIGTVFPSVSYNLEF